MAVDDILKLDVNFELQKNPNTYDFVYRVEVAGGTDAADALALATFFNTTPMTNILPIQTDAINFTCLVVTRIDPSPLVPQKVLTGVAGTKVTDSLPGQCSMVLQLHKDESNDSARQRGRDFWSGFVEGDQDTGVWTNAAMDTIQNWYQTEILGTISQGGATFRFGVWSRTQKKENDDPQFVSNGGAVPDPPTFGTDPFTVVTYICSRTQVRTQRRRQPEDPCEICYVTP